MNDKQGVIVENKYETLAVSAWTQPETSMVEMDTRLAGAFIDILEQQEKKIRAQVVDEIRKQVDNEWDRYRYIDIKKILDNVEAVKKGE